MTSSVRWVWLFFFLAGCGGARTEPELVYGKRGVIDGDFVKPRAIAIDKDDRVYVVDWTARIQVCNTDGKSLHIAPMIPPDFRNGRPSGLSIHPDGGRFCCIALTNPSEVVITNEFGENHAVLTKDGWLAVSLREDPDHRLGGTR